MCSLTIASRFLSSHTHIHIWSVNIFEQMNTRAMNNNYVKNAFKYLLKNRFAVCSSSFYRMYTRSAWHFQFFFFCYEREKTTHFLPHSCGIGCKKICSGMHRYEPQSSINREIGCSKQLLRLSFSWLFFGIALVIQHLVSLPFSKCIWLVQDNCFLRFCFQHTIPFVTG